MIGRHLLALVRCLALYALAVAGLLVSLLSVVAATLVVPYPLAASGIRGLADLSRRLSRDWAGVEIQVEERTVPPVPQRREDGWYVHDRQLYKSRHLPAFLLRMQWLSHDPGFAREWRWLVLTPFLGGLAALIAPALVVAGVLVALLVPGAAALSGAGLSTARLSPATFATGAVTAGLAAAAGVVLVVLGFALAPIMVRVDALWNRMLLQAPGRSWWHRSGIGPWLRKRSRATWHGGELAGLSFAAFGGFLVTVMVIAISWGGLLPQVSTITRPLVDLYRRKVGEWTDEEMPRPYRPYPEPPIRDQDGSYRVGRSLHPDRATAIRAQRHGWVLRDPATWRDLLWMATTPLVAVASLIPASLVGYGFFGLAWQALWWAPWAVPIGLTTGTWVTPWYMWYAVLYVAPSLNVIADWASVPVGLALGATGLLLALPLLRLRGWWDRLLLNPTTAARLAQRVEHLTESRAEAVDAQAAELRRIERDLHDGAQARLVAVGLSLAAIERLMETDPDRARTLLAQARESSATALSELRDLVRGIHPPVLAERGLGDAVRAVALDTPLPVAVTIDMAGRAEPAVETAAYFAVCEALANAARHANAHRVDIDIRHRDGVLTITVTDDGRGGADPAAGTGLRGMRRRLGTFDGVLIVRSPMGGPTVLTMEVPCALSSPKTSIY
jgi:signal transduction histidine kinase